MSHASPAPTGPSFAARHLLGIEHLKPHEITEILDLADTYVDLNRRPEKHSDVLAGLTQKHVL